MKIRTKSIIMICAGFSILSLILTFTLHSIITKSYSDLEIKISSEHVERVLNQIDQELSNLEATAHDWSIWDDTFYFVQNKNEEYIQRNLQYESLEEIAVNFMVFYNNTDVLIYNITYDFEQEKEVCLPNNFFSYVTNNKDYLLTHQTKDHSQTGLVFYDENATPLLISVTPILKSDGESAIQGSLILGRFFDEAKIVSIGTITQLSFHLHPVTGSDFVNFNDPTTYIKEKPIVVQPMNSTYIAGFVHINDIFGSPIFIAEIGSDRAIYQHGLNVIQNTIISLLIFVLVLLVIVAIIVDRFITSRLTYLSNSVNEVRDYNDLSNHFPAKGNDEIALLEKNINTMLSSLQKTWSMKDSAEYTLQKKIEELERFKTITVDREIKMIELKKENKTLKDTIEELEERRNKDEV
ncbi:MAG: HAMP domain-containing protein [Candidatus Thermoplasmatota archaeon]|nr:HAMP domain-containing protein [Candidatus Thermoplasmatota archaeon]